MLECSPCGKKFSGYESYEQHLESEKHKKKMLSVLKDQSESIDPENCPDSSCSKTIKCQVCDSSFNSFESFQNHSITPEHALKVMLKRAESSVTPSSNSAINNHELNAAEYKVESTDEESILPELNAKSLSLSYGSCKVCSKIFSGPEPYKQHLESQTHKKKVALSQNTTNVGGNLLKCEPCNKSFSGEVPYAQHMSSETHKKKLQNIEFVSKYLSKIDSNSQAGKSEMEEKIDENKQWFCYICNVQCSGLIPYNQHMEGSTHFKNARRTKSQNNFVTTDSGMAHMMQANNLNGCKISEKSANISQLVNGNYQEENEEKQSDFVISEISKQLKVVSEDELAELIKVIPSDKEINFDELDTSKDLVNGRLDILKQGENQNNETFIKFKESNENSFNDGIKKEMGEENKSEVHEICKVCNELLFDKDSAVAHYESKEHFEKRWNIKM